MNGGCADISPGIWAPEQDLLPDQKAEAREWHVRRWIREATDDDVSGNSSGAPGGIRTPNLLIRSQMLYPLSHGRIVLCTLLNVTAFNSVMQIRVIQSPEIRLTSGFAEHQMRDTRPPRGIVDPNSRTFIRGTTSPTMHKARRPL